MNDRPSVKAEILAAIANETDARMRTILLLMVGMMEEIGGKIDSIYSDIPALRREVLNGHADVHHDDHEFIRELRTQEKALAWNQEQYEESIKDKQSKREIVEEWLKNLLWAVTLFVGGIILSRLFPHIWP